MTSLQIDEVESSFCHEPHCRDVGLDQPVDLIVAEEWLAWWRTDSPVEIGVMTYRHR